MYLATILFRFSFTPLIRSFVSFSIREKKKRKKKKKKSWAPLKSERERDEMK
jgi:hypothetical protein